MHLTSNQTLGFQAPSFSQSGSTLSDAFYTVTQLRERGWTMGLIDRFLGHADSHTQNPRFRRGRPMKFFASKRVHSVESDDAFEEQTQASLLRKRVGQKSIEEKTQALVALAKTADPHLPGWSLQELAKQANQLIGVVLDDEEHRRAQLSVLMQFCGSAEWMLDHYFWHPGIRPARIVIRHKALQKIMLAYPHMNDLALEWAKKEKGNAQIDIYLA